MQYFHNENMISTYNTKASQKRRERMMKAQSVLEEYELAREMEDALDAKEEKALNESLFNSIKTEHNRMKKDHSEFKHSENVYNEAFDTLCKDMFFYIVYESLLVDEEIKSSPENYNYIRESAYKFFDNMSKYERIIVNEGSGFDDIIQTSKRLLEEQINIGNGIDIPNILQKTLLSEDMLSFYAIESIKAKTAECLKNEKECSIIKENLINEDKYIDPSKSLFRYLFENNIQDVIDNSDEKDPDVLQDLTMLETILDYTILETANTLQLVKFDNIKREISKKK